MNIFDFLLKNKEWLFSGAGISIISVLYLILRKFFRKDKSIESHKKPDIVQNEESYIEKIYEYYKKSDYGKVIRTCTSSWPIDIKRYEILLNLKAASITFLGPIRPGIQFLGVLWRIGISQNRKEKPFNFYHREDQGIKFVLVGNNVVISDSHDETPSITGKCWDDFPRLAGNLRKLFEELKMSATNLDEHICNEIIKIFNKINSKSKNTTEILRLLTDNHIIEGFTFDNQVKIFNIYLNSILPRGGLSLFKNNNAELIINYQPKLNVAIGNSSNLPAIRIVLTQECNYNCKYCPQYNENYTETGRTIPVELFSKFVGITKSYGFASFRFTGGEPLMVGQNFLEIINENKIINNNNITIYLATNGSYLKRYISAFERINNLILKVSLDTIKPLKYKEIAGISSNYLDQILESMAVLKEKVRIGINTVVTKSNFSELDDLINFSVKNRFYLKLMDLNWYFDQKPHNYWNEQYIQLTDYIKNLKTKYDKFDIVKTIGNYGIPMSQIYINDETWVRIKDHTIGSTYSNFCESCDFFPCQEGLYQLTLTADGKLKVCRHRPDTSIDISNMLSEGNEQEIRDSITFQLNRFFFNSFFVERKGSFSPP